MSGYVKSVEERVQDIAARYPHSGPDDMPEAMLTELEDLRWDVSSELRAKTDAEVAQIRDAIAPPSGHHEVVEAMLERLPPVGMETPMKIRSVPGTDRTEVELPRHGNHH